MKKRLLLCAFLLCVQIKAIAAENNLIEVYQQALQSDPVFQQAISQRLANSEDVPINLAALLPNVSATIAPSLSRTLSSGSGATSGNFTSKGYAASLNLTQTIFDFGKFSALMGASAISKQADATLSAATQDLITRVASAYFAVLQDHDIVLDSQATRTAFAKQLEQAKQQYQVGLKTITEVYTAQASYQRSVAENIAAENTLANDKENLRAITGNLYPSLGRLSEKFPLVTPHPSDIEAWATTAQQQNWSIKAAQYAAESARQTIKQQFAGHLPTLNAQGSYAANVSTINGTSFIFQGDAPGAAQTHVSTVTLNLAVPIFAGGGVIAQTNQAKYNFQVAEQQLEQQRRSTMNITRQSYLGIIAGISKIAADKQAIKSSVSSLEGMEAGYRVGTDILVNVLNQQQKVFEAKKQYALDRYAYVNNLLALKKAAGTLSQDDLAAINAWLEISG